MTSWILTTTFIMNLLDKKLRLILILASFLISCEDEDPNEIGTELDPNQDNVVVKFVEIVVDNSVTYIDSIVTTNSGRLLVGRHSNPEFGLVEAEAYTELIPDFVQTIADSARLDSAILDLKYSYFFGQDFQLPQTISVHALTDTLPVFNNFSSAKLEFIADSMGQATVQVFPEVDTLVSIPLNTELGISTALSIFNIVRETDFISQVAFANEYPGIAIVGSEENTAIIGFNPNESRLNLYFSYPGDTVASNYILPMGIGAVSYSSIIGERVGTQISGLDQFYLEVMPEDSSMYLQSGTGILPKLEFQSYLNFLDTIDNIIINLAELQIGPINPFEVYQTPPATLLFAAIDSTNVTFKDPTLRINQELILGQYFLEYNEAESIYVGRITSLIRFFTDGNPETTQLLLAPSPLENAVTVNQLITPNNSVKLKIFYTTFN